MVATLMLDGRCEDSAFVLPFSYFKGVSIAFGSYVSYKKLFKQAAMLHTFLEDGSTLPEEVDRIIREELGKKLLWRCQNTMDT